MHLQAADLATIGMLILLEGVLSADNALVMAVMVLGLPEADRTKQAKMWQDLNKQAMADVAAIPTRFERQQRMTGNKVGQVYLWPAYGSWPYGDMYVKQ